MNGFLRTTVGLVLASATIAPASPAHAVGEGCVGFPSIPAAFLCITQFTPGNAVPTTGTQQRPLATVPAFCYLLDCTDPIPVSAPVPTVTPGSGDILVINHWGTTYRIGGSSMRRVDESIGVGTQVTGLVAATNTDVGAEGLTGLCGYVGVTTLNGRIQYMFGGGVVSYSTIPASQPQATQGVCKLVSPNQPGVPGSEPTYTQSTSIAVAGAVVLTPPAHTSSHPVPTWPPRPVLICVSGFGVYGPTPPAENPRYLTETCSVNAL